VPRAGLNPERVAAEAAAVADEVGLDRLTLAAVAQRLGVSLPSLYKHVRGLDGLRRDLSVLSVREVTGVLAAAAVGRSGRDALVAIAAAYREYARAHPGRAAATVRAPDPDDAEYLEVAAGAVQVLRAVLAGCGVGEEDAVDAIRCLRAAMHGFAVLERAGGFGLPDSVDATYVRLIDGLYDMVAAWADGRRR
jgi:AcrR family transcriptional regulator